MDTYDHTDVQDFSDALVKVNGLLASVSKSHAAALAGDENNGVGERGRNRTYNLLIKSRRV